MAAKSLEGREEGGIRERMKERKSKKETMKMGKDGGGE